MRHAVPLLLSLTLLFAANAVPAQQFSSLEERMTGSEFKAAGLDKLSPEQLAALNAWLRNEQAKAPVAVNRPVEDRRGFPLSRNDQGPAGAIESRIVGEITGLGDKQTFTLENGQIWQVNDSGRSLGGIKLNNPQVTIEPGRFGGWYVALSGYNTKLKVKRIK